MGEMIIVNVRLRHYASGHEIIGRRGFSWTTLFFGFFPALFRGDIKWAAIMFVVHLVVGGITMGLGLIVTWLIFAFIYNGRHLAELGKKGYVEVDWYAPPVSTENKNSPADHYG